MKILVSTIDLASMIKKAINLKCSYFILLPNNQFIHFIGEYCDFKEQVEICDKKFESITVCKFDNELMNSMFYTLSTLVEQPILLMFDKAQEDRLCIRLISQIIDKTWLFQN
jgi:hypothetical protein